MSEVHDRSIDNALEQTQQPIQGKESKSYGAKYSYQPHELGEASKRCIDIADKITKNPNSKVSKEDLSVIRTHKHELKDNVRALQKRDNEITKKILNLGKRILHIERRGPSKLEAAQAEHQAVREAYKNIIDSNPSVKQAKAVQILLKNANAELAKAGNEWDQVDCQFKTKFDEQAQSLMLFGDITTLLGPKTDNLQQREVFFERLVSGLEQIRCSEALKQKPISWLHGTRSPALTLMMASDKTMHPTGTLLKHNIIPLTGELGVGIHDIGVNSQGYLSGTSISRLGIESTIGYASRYQASVTNEWDQVSPNHINKIIGWAEEQLMENPNLEGRDGQGIKFDWLKLGIFIERLKVIDPEYSEKISTIKSHLDNVIVERQQQPGQEKLVEFLRDVRGKCDTPPFITPTQSIRRSVTDSFPIVLAASNVTGRLIDPNDYFDEHAVKGSLSLEKISVAFTTSENVDRLQKMVAEAGLDIEVMDFNALKAISVNAPRRGVVNRPEI